MNTPLRALTTICVSIATAALVVGCSSKEDKWTRGRPPVYPANGQVMLDGQPVAEAMVTFQPVDESGKGGAARTDANGYFEAQTFEPGDGLTEGAHRVAIQKTKMVDRQGNEVTVIYEPGDAIERNFLPAKYAKYEKSDIEVQIDPVSENDLGQIQLTK
ncbi:carboxypeptidase-like regulatory domain-containing protein [Blastopirellula retiformator]|uniref:Nickel uptake substrate-specific transmembrane region n=1 Tax=Blastopirellula retiformator TaxID=2527970 RepID=A0A5C5V1D2_9BACT|nr:carboxypeptidase-like regulatory domain-containing protein [Blastopirellula retiformator]TWT31803.1 hypothetical protein Enr8_37280 [Blastopirellula retiformator]